MSTSTMPLFSNAPAAPVPAPSAQRPLWSQDLGVSPVEPPPGALSPVPSQARITPAQVVPNAPSESPRAPTRSIGYAVAGQATAWWGYTAEDNPELQWPNSVDTFDRMRRTDPQVMSVLRAVALPVRRTRWYIDPNGADPEIVAHVAADLGLPIGGVDTSPTVDRTRDRFSWAQHLIEIMEMLTFGHSYFEPLVRIEEDGWGHLRKLEYRPPETIAKIDVAPDGGLRGIRQRPLPGTGVSEAPYIPVRRLVAHVHERVGGDWVGRSLLRAAYKPWLLKDEDLRVQAGTNRRNGMGVPVYTGAEHEEERDPLLDAGRELAQSWGFGQAAGGAIPYSARMELLGVTGTLPDVQRTIDYHDSQIARAVLAHFLNLGTQTGSWALGSTFADFFTLSLQTLAETIRDVTTQHVIEDLVDYNWGRTVRAPRLEFDEIGSRQTATAQAVKLLVDAGIITADDNLERAMRGQLGLPGRGGATVTPPADPAADPDVQE